MTKTETEETCYSRFWEYWWSTASDKKTRELRIGRDAFTAQGYSNGCVYECFIREHHYNGKPPFIRLEIFDEAFKVFHNEALKKFWKRLDGCATLEDVIDVLEELNIPDRTKRERN